MRWRTIFQLLWSRNVFIKIGFYFVFMDYYTKMLSIPSILGLLVFIGSIWSMRDDDELRNVCDENATPGNFWMCPICHPPYCEAWEMYKEGCRKYKWEFALDNEGTLTLSCLVTLWAIFFLKFWKRRESTMASQFNTLRFKSRHSGMRPDYEIRSKTVQKNPVTGEVEPHVPLRSRILWHSVSILCTLSILAMAGLCLVGLVVSRIALYAVFHKMGGHLEKHNVEASRWFTHGLIFLLIAIFEGIYKFLVGKLTKYECPRTPHDFMNNMLWKLFVFELLIDFVPICYAAWLKGRTVQTPLNLNWLTELCDAGCTSEVVELVFVLLFLRLIVGNFLEIAVPFFRHCFRKFRHVRRASHRNLPQWLKDYYLNEVEMDGVFEDYMEMMVQFAFVVLFPPVFPLAALICLVNNILEIRVDAIKMLKTNRKPLPLRASGIHIWNTFMDVIVKLGIIFNAGLIAFTSEVIPRLYYTYHRATDIHRRHIGYLEYSLSYIYIKDWEDEAKIEEMVAKNITKCYYMGYREPDYPYPHKHDYWRIITVRLAAFTVYSIGFFVLMYLVNLMISDTPTSVRTRLDRHTFLVKKHLDQERRQAREAVRRVKRVHPSLLIRTSVEEPKKETTKF